MPANNKAQRQEVKAQARTAASQGTYSRANTQAMRSAGVNPNTINQIRSSAPVAIGTSTRNSNYGGTTTTYTSPSGQPMTAAQVANATRPSYNSINSIGEGLRIGDNQYLSAKEAMKISKATGKDYDKVLQKGMDKGLSISAGAIRKSNNAYATSKTRLYSSLMDQTFGQGSGSKLFPDSLGMFRDQKPTKGTAYGGSTIQMDGRTLPVFDRKQSGTKNPLAIKSSVDPITKPDPTTPSNPNPDPSPKVDPVQQAPTQPLTQDPLGPGGLYGGGLGGANATSIGKAKKGKNRNTKGTGYFNRDNTSGRTGSSLFINSLNS